MTVESNKTLGEIGAGFLALGVVSSIISAVNFFVPKSGATTSLTVISLMVGVFSLVGFFIFFAAMYGFSKDYNESKLFNYLLYGLILTIMVAVVVAIVAILIFASTLSGLNIAESASSSQITAAMQRMLALFVPVVSFAALIWVVFNVRALNLMAEKSQVPLFRDAAKVLFAGAVLTVAIGIVAAILSGASVPYNSVSAITIPGSLVQNASYILMAMAYSRIKPPPPAPNLTIPQAI